jgi:uncharacterized protein (TIGR04255 family)
VLFEEPVPRVRYHLNPLVEVVCEVQFKPNSLSEAARVALTDALAADYPELEHDGEDYVLRWAHDRQWALSAGHDFAALTTQRYTSWQELRGRFVAILSKLPAQVAIAAVPVKYVDVIVRERLGLSGPWSSLLRPELVGMLDSEISDSLAGSVSTILVQLSDADQLRLQHGLAREEGIDEPGYMLDALFSHQGEMPREAVMVKMDKFNRCARAVFHWATTPLLRGVLSPEPLED